ncbi:MAG: TRAP transporter small permease subunit [Arhodomonas sp.]|nr:TRAP transporter small permease subunit [Arhodomonas sp.]
MAVALAMSAYASWWAVDLVRGSIAYGDVSPGLLAVPLWIPQSAMATGLAVFTLSLADNLARMLRGITTPVRRGRLNGHPGDRRDAGGTRYCCYWAPASGWP